METVIDFLKARKLLEEVTKAQTVKRQAMKYALHDKEILCQSTTKTDVHPYLKCLRPSKVLHVLREIHEGICGNHPPEGRMMHTKHCICGTTDRPMVKDAR